MGTIGRRGTRTVYVTDIDGRSRLPVRQRMELSMVKGINKNVIEIVDTGNELFERAILFIRPGEGERSEEHLREGADTYLSGLRIRKRILMPDKMIRIMFKYGAAAALGAVTAMMLLRG